jgi:LuxR family maltose regulon positive regulatory protein
MARLRYAALSHGVEPGYVRRLLAALPHGQGKADIPSRRITPEADWIEPLSERELEVLQLIAEGLTNPEIATTLYHVFNTVKVHTCNIYSKLDAHHRAGAVARARAWESCGLHDALAGINKHNTSNTSRQQDW